VDAAGWIIGTTGLAVGVVFGFDQMRRNRVVSNQLERLEALMIERAPERAEFVAKRITEEPTPLDQEVLVPIGAEAVARAIRGLPEREKLAVTLYYYEELTLREIAEILGVSEGQVSELLTRAVLRLKSRLGTGSAGATTK
jgi:RNA polymerase sigma factor (sigma-70 family)